jgi:hypothetical protein
MQENSRDAYNKGWLIRTYTHATSIAKPARGEMRSFNAPNRIGFCLENQHQITMCVLARLSVSSHTYRGAWLNHSATERLTPGAGSPSPTCTHPIMHAQPARAPARARRIQLAIELDSKLDCAPTVHQSSCISSAPCSYRECDREDLLAIRVSELRAERTTPELWLAEGCTLRARHSPLTVAPAHGRMLFACTRSSASSPVRQPSRERTCKGSLSCIAISLVHMLSSSEQVAVARVDEADDDERAWRGCCAVRVNVCELASAST